MGKFITGDSGTFGKGVPNTLVLGVQQANLIINHAGAGTLVSVGNGDPNQRIFSISIDGVHFAQFTLESRMSIRFDIPFLTGYIVYESVAGQPVATNHRTNANVDVVLTANAGASGVQPSQLSDTGSGVIKVVSMVGSPTLVVDSVTILSTQGGTILETEIKYNQSFDYQNSVAQEFFFNKIS